MEREIPLTDTRCLVADTVLSTWNRCRPDGIVSISDEGCPQALCDQFAAAHRSVRSKDTRI